MPRLPPDLDDDPAADLADQELPGQVGQLAEAVGGRDRVQGAQLLRSTAVVHAEQITARAAGGMRYVHLACTEYLTHTTPVTCPRSI
jgi:hypothetical protein